MATQVLIEADTVQVNGAGKYRLYASCTDKGSLQDVYIFLINIVNASNPLTDTFERVIKVADFEAALDLKTNRAVAVMAGRTQWRSSQMWKYFDDVEVAAAAKIVLQDEINRLTNDYTAYTVNFADMGTVESFPTTEPSATDALKNTYETDKTAYEDALVEKEAAAATLTAAQTTYDTTVTSIENRDALKDEFSALIIGVEDARQTWSNFMGTPPGTQADSAWIVDEIENFINEYAVAPGSGVDVPVANLETAKNYYEQNRRSTKNNVVNGTFATTKTGLDTLLSTIDTTWCKTDADLISAASALATAKTAKVEADADVSAKYAQMDTAYAAAKAVCPQWNVDAPPPPLP